MLSVWAGILGGFVLFTCGCTGCGCIPGGWAGMLDGGGDGAGDVPWEAPC